MIEEIRENLLMQINPFWKKLRDDKKGGFCGYVDYSLEKDVTAEKGVILNSRILWFFSNEYLLFKNEEDLAYAHHAYKFLKEKCLDLVNGGVYWMLDAEGNPTEDMKHTYNQAFAIYALSSYYEAAGKEEALEVAKQLFKIIEEKCTDEIGYVEAFDREWMPIDNDKLSDNKHLCAKGIIAEKTMNTLLHILEAYTELYRVSRDKAVGDKLKQLLVVFETKVWNDEKDLLEVFFDHNLETVCDMHSYGHDIEGAWLLDRACEVLGDDELIERTKAYTVKIAYKILEEAYEENAVNNERFEELVDKTRVWWVQAESIVGFTNAYQKTGDKRFLEVAHEIWEYVKTHLIDSREGGEWFWEVDILGNVSQKPIVEPWKCPYHNGRMCFEIIRRNENV